MNILDFKNKKSLGEKLSMLTCYDFWSAQILNTSAIDALLVGDSLAMVMHGHTTTLPADPEVMALHTRAVVKGAPDKLVIADLPFLSFRKSLDQNMNAVEAVMKAGAQAIKLEGADGNLELITHLVHSGVPVMGHLGLTPQSVHQLGGYKVQGRNDRAAEKIFNDARRLQEAGCFAVVLECVPTPIAGRITEALEIPTIGIGAGAQTDGQVLVLQDMLGVFRGFQPKFVRHYFNGFDALLEAVNQYDRDVKDQNFPGLKESYE